MRGFVIRPGAPVPNATTGTATEPVTGTAGEPVPALVTLHVWRVPARLVPAALARMATGRLQLGSGRSADSPTTPRFAKLLGTGSGRTFTPRDATPRRWALLATWTDADDADRFEARHPLPRGWQRLAESSCRLDLVPISARGRWAGREPFGPPGGAGGSTPAAAQRQTREPIAAAPLVAAITRARLRPSRALAFWRSVPPVVAELRRAPGLRLAFGIGEAPVGLQGTFSVWDSTRAMSRFAYQRPEHAAVVHRTRQQGWYAEELFATFVVRRAAGALDVIDPAGALDVIDPAGRLDASRHRSGGWA